jgi:hypothetical protein
MPPCTTTLAATKARPLSHSTIAGNALDLGEVPLLVAQWAHTSRLQPALNAVQVENMTAVSECYTQTILVVWRRAGLYAIPKEAMTSSMTKNELRRLDYLILDRRLVQGVSTDGTCVGANIPRPHRYGVPFLDFEPNRASASFLLAAFLNLLFHIHLLFLGHNQLLAQNT